MDVVKPPNRVMWGKRKSLFLAGTIDNGSSEDWQSRVQKALADEALLILNPRRDEWDASWRQSIENEPFKEQVEWELDGLEGADLVLLYLAPGSVSPISLLELGLFAHSKKMVIVCPEGYWRKGNVEVVADRFSIPMFETLEAGIDAVESRIL